MPGTALTIGNFDGVHRGHAALVERCRALVGGDGRVVVMSFDPHPMTVLRPASAPARLTTFPQREKWLRSLGADEVVRLAPTSELLAMPPEAFVGWFAEKFRPRFVVEGDDFHFGRARAGTTQTLQTLGAGHGFVCEVVPAVEVSLSDDLMVRASSSVARWLISQGRARDAATVLGRPYTLVGTVEKGDQRGRTIGYPTANLRTECLLPADGVYAGEGVLPDGQRLTAAVNVGTRPTFDGEGRRLEAYLLDADTALAGLEYGWPLEISLISWLRDDMKFAGIGPLVEQIQRDCDRAREAVGLWRGNGVGRSWRPALEGVTG